MPVFALSVSAQQSPDGKTVTINDDSNWGVGNNDSNYTTAMFTRELILTDAEDNPIIIIPLGIGILSAIYNVPEKTNPWLNIDLSVVGPVTLDKTVKLPAQRYFELAYIDSIKENCGCSCLGDVIGCEIDAFVTGSLFAIPIGDSVNYQADIDAAYKLLTSV